MTVKYKIVRYHPDLMPKLAELQTHLLGPDVRRNRAYLEWKYEQNPYLSKPHVYAALCDGEAVAMRGLFGSRWVHGPSGEAIEVPHADDGVVHPCHRDRGLIAELMSVAFEDLNEAGFRYTINLSAGPVSFFMFLTRGWRSVVNMRPLEHSGSSAARYAAWPASRPARKLARTVISRAPFLEDVLTRRFWARHWKIEGEPDLEFSEKLRPSEMADLVSRLPRGVTLAHDRDAAYFAWRYRNPYRRYRFLYLDGKDGLDGYLAIMIRPGTVPHRTSGSIVDWAAVSREAERWILGGALRSGCVKMTTWSATLSGGTLDDLGELGFVPAEDSGPRRFTPALLVRSVAQPDERGWTVGGLDLLQPASWSVRLIDSMHG